MAERCTLDDVGDKKLRQDLAELLAERAKYTRVKKEAEESEKVASGMIIPILQRLGYKSIYAEDDLGEPKFFTMSQGSSSSIKKELLINAGVDPEIIDACTKHTKFLSLQVRGVKQSGSSESEDF